VCNRPGAKAIERAKSFGIPVGIFDHRVFVNREAHEIAILEWLRPLCPHLLVLAGYMRLFTARLLSEYRGRVINIHPADTRQHQGADGYAWARGEGLTKTWITVHWVDDGMDTGEVIMQAPVPILAGDTLEDLRARGLAIEHQLYPRALAKVISQLPQDQRRL
ncbi:MAG: phosphoribosylglycinamide formyltransferase, partial [Cyanobacteria bacterium NC_groundwater_1444_Ag_S-0.65um_54_12]|nr:phosphoribosylglycinamide formyltransferase [Cyanobacteria bacterium NC_groundwater_1444_Ag_S-0.65um_54_12]